MKYRIADPAEEERHQQHLVRREQPGDRQRAAMHDQPAHQHRLRADPVHQHRDGHLGDQSGEEIDRHDEAEFGIAHAERRLDQDEQGRQHQMIEMADQMRAPDQPDGGMFAALKRGGEGGHLSACSPTGAASRRVPVLNTTVSIASRVKAAEAKNT